MAIEATMASLAHSQITQSLPSLASSVQGFQLIHSNEDESKAIGVVVLLLGDTCVYVPAIYRGGKIYNMDIMYVPEMQQWLPAQDNWITYLRANKPDLVGMMHEKKDGKGGKAPGAVQLDIPFTHIVKAASAEGKPRLPILMKHAAEEMAKELSEPVTSVGIPSSMETLVKADPKVAASFLNTIAEYPSVGNSFVQFYSNDDLLELAGKIRMHADEDARKRKEFKGTKAGGVKLLTMASSESKDLPSDSKVKLIRDGAIIVDNRGLVPTKVYKTKNNADWGTANTTGMYELLKSDGSTLTALVLQISNSQFCIVPLDDFNSRNGVLVNEAPLGQAFPFEGLSIPKTMDLTTAFSDEDEGYYDNVVAFDNFGNVVRLGHACRGTLVVTGNADSANVIVRLANGGTYAKMTGRRGNDDCFDNAKVNKIEQLPAGAKIRLRKDTLYVPEDCHFIKASFNRENTLDLADFGDLQESIIRKDNMTKIKVNSTSSGIVITDDSGKVTEPLGKKAAELDIVRRFGVTPESAEMIVKEASEDSKGQARFLLKIATSTNYAINIAEEPMEEDTEESIDLTNNVLPEDDRKTLEIAGNSGIKEVMDVTVLKLLANDGTSIRQVQEFVPKLFSAMDSVARLLFMIRAGDAMSESYGESRASDMEKQFAQLVENIGDAIICLQQGRINNVHDLLEGPLARTLG